MVTIPGVLAWRQWILEGAVPRTGFPGNSPGKESTCNSGDPGSIFGSGRFPGEGIGYPLPYSWVPLVAQMVKNLPSLWEGRSNLGSIPGLGRLPERGHGNPFQYSCLGNPLDRGAWRATVHWVAKSRTRLSKQANNVRMCINRILLMVFTYYPNETKTCWFITLALVMVR